MRSRKAFLSALENDEEKTINWTGWTLLSEFNSATVIFSIVKEVLQRLSMMHLRIWTRPNSEKKYEKSTTTRETINNKFYWNIAFLLFEYCRKFLCVSFSSLLNESIRFNAIVADDEWSSERCHKTCVMSRGYSKKKQAKNLKIFVALCISLLPRSSKVFKLNSMPCYAVLIKLHAQHFGGI